MEISGATSLYIKNNDIENALKRLDVFKNKKEIGYSLFFDGGGEYLGGFVKDRIIAMLPGKDLKSSDTSPESIVRSISLNISGKQVTTLDIVLVKFAEKTEEGRKIIGGIEIGFINPQNCIERIFLYNLDSIYGVLSVLIFLLLLSTVVHVRTRTKLPPPMEKHAPDFEDTPVGHIERVEDLPEPVIEGLDTSAEDQKDDGADIFKVDFNSYKQDTEETKEIEIDKAEGWVSVYNGWDIDDWEKEGIWYVNENIIVGKAWKASLIRNDIKDSNYEFKFRAKKITGRDGFVALFKCSAKYHAWVIGGWNGSRSELMKIEQTETKDKIEQGKWYEVKVSVLDKKVEGYLNDRKAWSIDREVLEKIPSQDVFLQGVGVAVWNTICKFGEIQYRKR